MKKTIVFLVLTLTLSACSRKINQNEIEEQYKENQVSLADYLVGEYDDGGIEIDMRHFPHNEYELKAEGLNSGNMRMTRVYSNGESELALSYAYLTETENLLVKQVEEKSEIWFTDPYEGDSAVMTLLPTENEGEYFTVYAESTGMTANELRKAMHNNVIIKTSWGSEFNPVIYNSFSTADLRTSSLGDELNKFKWISMEVLPETVTSTGLSLLIKSTNVNESIYGDYFGLEVRLDETWYALPYAYQGNIGWFAIGYSVPKGGGERTVDINWKGLYGILPGGDYRIIKDILDFRKTGDYTKYWLAAEFHIESDG